MEGEAQDLDEEVDGVAGFIPLRPTPVAVFDNEAGKGREKEIARFLFHQLESALLEQWNQRGQSGGADLFACPPRLLQRAAIKRWVGHSLSSNGAE